jgi:serine/threonine protein kinase
MAITDYEMLKEIGRGGMGAVYLALDPRLERKVAIKKIKVPENLDEQTHKELVQRFYREARAIANISHPNIVIVHELGEDKETNQCFMVMEFLEGKSLESLQEEQRKLPLGLVMRIGIQGCDALNFIHQKDILHRDIKPANLIYCTNGMVKITDFGLVRTNDNLNLTKAGSIMGSVLFMPLEQIENPKNVDFRCDMYSFGVTLYNMLSGNFPYYGDDVYGIIRKLMVDDPVPLSKYNSDVPPLLENIIMKAISKKKENRFASMAEFQKALIQFAQVENISFTDSYSHYLQVLEVTKPPETSNDLDKTIISTNNKDLDKTIVSTTNDLDKTIVSNKAELEKTVITPIQSNSKETQLIEKQTDTVIEKVSNETKQGNVNLEMTTSSAPTIKDLPSKYHVVKELGRGGMGAVYLAQDRSLDRQVAIKVLTFEVFPDQQDVQDEVIYTFKREAIAISNLNHINIVNVYDIGQTKSGLHYIVMELLEGEPMTKMIKDEKPMVPEIALDAIIQICDALQYIHNNKVIHRDIKPENIMYSDKGIAKLTDFGIAKFVDDKPVKASGNLVGTILYISPEQLQNPEGVDGRADMYSLAVSLYQLLTGKLPINGDDVREVIMKIINEKPLPPSKLNPALPRSLDEILFKAMAKEKNDRYRNLDDFKNALLGIAKYKDYLNSKRKQIDTSEENKKVLRKVNDYTGHVDLGWLDNIGDKIESEQAYFSRSMDYLIPKIAIPEVKEFTDTLIVNSLDGKRRHWDAKIKQVVMELDTNPLIHPKLKAILIALQKHVDTYEALHFLVTLDNKTNLSQIISLYYAPNKLKTIFSLLFAFAQAEIVKFEVQDHIKGKIYIGEMMIKLFFITRDDLNKALKEQPPTGPKTPIGEILLKKGALKNENLMYALKMQVWYKGLFNR